MQRHRLAATLLICRGQKVRIVEVGRRRLFWPRRRPIGKEVPTRRSAADRPTGRRHGRIRGANGVRRRLTQPDDDAEVQNDDDDERHDAVRDKFEVLEHVHHEIVVVSRVTLHGRALLVEAHRPEDVDVIDGDHSGERCRCQPGKNVIALQERKKTRTKQSPKSGDGRISTKFFGPLAYENVYAHEMQKPRARQHTHMQRHMRT